MHRWLICSLLLLPLLMAAGAALADLDRYVTRPEPEFRWSKEGETSGGLVKLVNLKVRSQVWREIPWEHQVRVFLPPSPKHPKTALLFVTGGNPGLEDTLLFTALAPRLKAPLIVLYNIPNQPLFGDRREDDLIAHTFQEYLRTGDETWPLLFPMVKSVVRTMDAVQELSRKEWATPVEGFVVTGASKRGWTTYLTAAADRRVRGIAPMVFDNLNFQEQMERQLGLWGRFSEQIEDYTRRGLQQQMETARGRKLLSLVDPWSYRERLTMPKLLIHGANDRYWATDATRAYWNGLPGDKYLLSVPNAGHGLEDRQRVVNTLVAFFGAVADGRRLPRLREEQRVRRGEIVCRVRADVAPREARLWTVRAPDLDFRPAKWESTPLGAQGGELVGRTRRPEGEGLALFTEAEFEREGEKFTLSTPPTVYGRRAARNGQPGKAEVRP